MFFNEFHSNVIGMVENGRMGLVACIAKAIA